MPPWDSAAVRRSAGVPPTAAQLATLLTETDDKAVDWPRAVSSRSARTSRWYRSGSPAPGSRRALHRGGLSPAGALRTATVLPSRLSSASTATSAP